MTTYHPFPRQKTRLAIAFLAVTAFFVSISDARIFTSAKDGRTVEGKIVGATEDIVRLNLGTRRVEIPLSALIEADRRYIELWRKEQAKSKVPDLEISISTGLNRRRDPDYFSYEYYDANFDFEIRMENDERDFDVTGAKGTLVVIGKNCEKNYDNYVVMQKETFPITVKAKDEFKWNGPEVQFRYAEGNTYQTGYKYYSYIFQIKNAAGKVIYEKVMANRFKDVAEAILKFEEEDKFDGKGKPVKSSRTVF
jgi:hypothetical protein